MPQRVLALEVGAHEFKAAYVDASYRDYRVTGFHRGPISPDGTSRADQLKRFLTTHGMLGASTILSALPADIVTWRTFVLPFRDRKKLEQTVPFELESQVPFGLDEVVIDYHVVNRSKEGSKILAALIRRPDLESHLQLLSDAGVDPKIVDVSSLTMLNVLRLTEKDLPDSFLYVGGTDDHVTVAIYRDGELAGLRTINPPPPQSEAAEAVAPSNGHAPGHADRLANTVAEIRWSMMALADAPIEEGTTCLVAGEGVLFDGIRQHLANQFGLQVRVLAGGELKQVPAELRSQLGSFMTTVGLALREVAPNESMGVNFRRGEYAYHAADEETRRALRGTIGLAVVVVALILGHTYAEYERLVARAAVLDNAVRSVFQHTLEGVNPTSDMVGQIQAEIDAEQKKLDVLSQVVPVDGATAIDAVRAIAVALPPSVKIDVDEFTMDTGQIRMKSSTESFETADVIKQKIAATKYFGNVEVKNVKQCQDGQCVDFMLMLDLSKSPPPAVPEE